MNCFKKAIAAVSVMLIALTAAACHPKDEVAVTVGDVKFTSAYYMCALINADSQAKSKVKESLSDDESSTDVDYYSKKVEDKDFVKWVEDTALDTLKKIAAYKTLCKENKLEIPDNEKTQAETYADYYWSSYRYSAYFEPNGVGQSTYKQYMLDSYYSNLYFEHLYGAEGTKAIDSETVKQKMYDNFVIADLLQVSFSSKTDDEKTELKEKVNTYADELKNGKKDTAYESDQYDTVKAMATGEVKVIELEDNAGLVLAVKQDISADDYYTDTLDLTARHLIKDDEYEKEIKDYASKLKTETNKYAVKQFKVKKIKEPSAS